MELEELEKKLEKDELFEKEKKTEKKVIKEVVGFSNQIIKRYGDLIKSILIFGSAVRGDIKETSDIDVLVLIDDTAQKATESLEKITNDIYMLAEENRIHPQVFVLTEFWKWLRAGSPELVNYLRYGYSIYDTGFIKPVQRMLKLGLIPPSEETIMLKAKGAQLKFKKFESELRSLIFELRYMAFDMIQSVIMYFYKAQPDYKDAKKYLEKLKEENKISDEEIKKFEELNKLWKDIDHKIIKKISLEHLKKAFELTEYLIEKFKSLLPKDFVLE